MKSRLQDQSGQGTFEFVLLFAFIGMVFLTINTGLKRAGVAEKLLAPIKGRYAATYQFGHPEAKSKDTGGVEHHPRAAPGSGKENFRLFINPAVTN